MVKVWLICSERCSPCRHSSRLVSSWLFRRPRSSALGFLRCCGAPYLGVGLLISWRGSVAPRWAPLVIVGLRGSMLGCPCRHGLPYMCNVLVFALAPSPWGHVPPHRVRFIQAVHPAHHALHGWDSWAQLSAACVYAESGGAIVSSPGRWIHASSYSHWVYAGVNRVHTVAIELTSSLRGPPRPLPNSPPMRHLLVGFVASPPRSSSVLLASIRLPSSCLEVLPTRSAHIPQ